MLTLLFLVILGALAYFFIFNPEACTALADRVKRLFDKGGLSYWGWVVALASVVAISCIAVAKADECRTLEFVQSVAAARGVKITELEKGAKNRFVDWVNAKPPVTNDKWDRVFYAEHDGAVVVFFMRGACIETYIVLPVDDFKAAVKPSGTAI